jgi:hypothetical protein
MQLSTSIVVPQDIRQVWRSSGDPLTAPSWDRSVAQVVPLSTAPVGVGYEAMTVAPSVAALGLPSRTVAAPICCAQVFAGTSAASALAKVRYSRPNKPICAACRSLGSWCSTQARASALGLRLG